MIFQQQFGKKIKLSQLSLTGNYENKVLPILPKVQTFFSPKVQCNKEPVQSPKKQFSVKTEPKKRLVNLKISNSSRNLDMTMKTTQFSISPCKSYRTSEKSLNLYEINLKRSIDHIYIIKLPLNDISQLKVMMMNRSKINTGYKEEDIYLKKKKLILEAQIGINGTRQHTTLLLYDYQQINFFEEIPQNCKLIFLTNKTYNDFWNILFKYHNIEINEDKQNKILNIIQYINNCDDLIKFFTDLQVFSEIMEKDEICSPYELFIQNPIIDQRIQNKKLQKSTTQQFELEISKNKNSNQFSVHILKTEQNDELKIVRTKQQNDNQYNDNDEIQEQKPEAFQTLFEKEGLNKITNNYSNRNLKGISQKNFICQQRVNIQTKSEIYQKQFSKFSNLIAKNQPLTTQYNIPKLIQQTGLNRNEIHEIYSRYKALLSYECSLIPQMQSSKMPEGIGKDSFAAGLNELSMAPKCVIDQLFNSYAIDNCLNFEGFLQIINLITAKSNEKKIELILKLIDENGNGLLSYEEISIRCEMMMSSLLQINSKEACTDNMVDIITRSIFDAVDMNYDDEIPIEKLKTLIESKCQASKSLLMMCCGDINYIE